MRLYCATILSFCGLLPFASVRQLNAQATVDDPLVQKAQQEFRAGQYADAERDFRAVTKRDPNYFYAQFYLGESLMAQQKYKEATGPYEKASALETAGEKLTLEQHRILLDQLVIAYGISGNLKKVHMLTKEGIRQDPDYPLNYYNLSCAFAEEGNKDRMLANLAAALDRRDKVLQGEHLPDPRTDDSFRKYVKDADFVKLLNDKGYR